jgi:hypothetical protein
MVVNSVNSDKFSSHEQTLELLKGGCSTIKLVFRGGWGATINNSKGILLLKVCHFYLTLVDIFIRRTDSTIKTLSLFRAFPLSVSESFKNFTYT